MSRTPSCNTAERTPGTLFYDNSQRVNVTGFVGPLSCKNLRRRVAPRSSRVLAGKDGFGVGKAEVYKFDIVSGRGNEDIGRFEVFVENPFLVHVGKGVANLHEYSPKLPFMAGVRLYPLVQSAAVYPFHFNTVAVIRKGNPGKDFADDRVFEGYPNLIFAPEHPLMDGIVLIGLFEGLIHNHAVVSVPFEQNAVTLRRLVQNLKVFPCLIAGQGLHGIEKAGGLNHHMFV